MIGVGSGCVMLLVLVVGVCVGWDNCVCWDDILGVGCRSCVSRYALMCWIVMRSDFSRMVVHMGTRLVRMMLGKFVTVSAGISVRGLCGWVRVFGKARRIPSAHIRAGLGSGWGCSVSGLQVRRYPRLWRMGYVIA